MKHADRRIAACLLAICATCASPAVGGDKYALVVGVETYIPTELPSLEYAEDDAEGIGRALEALGFSVITMTASSGNPRHRPTTAARILEQVQKRLDDRDAGDTIVLAFSGHGVQFRGDKEFYFCPGEAELRDRSSLVPMGRVLESLGRCGAGRKLLLVDACREELAPEAAGKGIAIELDPAGVFRAEPPTGTVALFSCQPKEKSYELKKFGHSVFTHHVIEYLTGKAAADRYPRQEVSVEELVPYVRNQTRESVDKLLGGRQKPEAIAPDATIPDWPLGTLAGVDRKPPPLSGTPQAASPPVKNPPPGPMPPAAASRRRSASSRVPPLPDGTPEQLLDFVASLRQTDVKLATRQEMMDFMRDVAAVCLQAADTILARVNHRDEMHDRAAGLKLESLAMLGRLGDEKAPIELAAYAASLIDSPSRELSKQARMTLLVGDAQQALATGDVPGMRAVVETVTTLLSAQPDDVEVARLAHQLVVALEQTRGGAEVAASARVALGSALARSANDRIRVLAENLRPIVENSVGMKLVRIPAGEFRMGSDETTATFDRALTAAGIEPVPVNSPDDADEWSPVHTVKITKPFRMAAHEVTLGQFLAFYHDSYKGKLDCEKDGMGGSGVDMSKKNSDERQRPSYRPWSWGHPDQTNDHPVVNVSWNDATAFCEWLSRKEGKRYRLPTEAEWEYACRAGTNTRYWCGDDFKTLVACDNVGDQTAKDLFQDSWKYHVTSRDGHALTAPVGSFRRPNPFGLHDMHGNVAEWCSDWHDTGSYAESPEADPTGPATGSRRVKRGGSWWSPAIVCLSAYRSGDAPTSRDFFVGFRVVCDLE